MQLEKEKRESGLPEGMKIAFKENSPNHARPWKTVSLLAGDERLSP